MRLGDKQWCLGQLRGVLLHRVGVVRVFSCASGSFVGAFVRWRQWGCWPPHCCSSCGASHVVEVLRCDLLKSKTQQPMPPRVCGQFPMVMRSSSAALDWESQDGIAAQTAASQAEALWALAAALQAVADGELAEASRTVADGETAAAFGLDGTATAAAREIAAADCGITAAD